MLLTQLQGFAQVDAQLDDLLPGQGLFLLDVLIQRRQQLHLNEDVPADVVLVLDHLVVFVAYHVAVALELAHEGKFLHQFLDLTVERGPDALLVHALAAHRAHLTLAGRNGDGLQGRLVHLPKVLTLDLEDLAEGPLANEPGDMPDPEDGFILFVVVDVHTFSLCNTSKFP